MRAGKMAASAEQNRRLRRVRALILDVDGVLTDGRIVLASDGRQVKNFDVRDGFGLVLARQGGLKTALITAERSSAVSLRARKLRVEWVAQGALDKSRALDQCLKALRVEASEAAFVGDDLLDLPALTRVGFSAAPADAHPEVRRRVHHVAAAPGGRGAVREIVEMILKARGRWKELLNRYLASTTEKARPVPGTGRGGSDF